MIEELCISGGSHRGLVFIGVLKYLIEEKVLDVKKLKKVVAVSIGTFVSMCFLIGYEMAELLQLVLDTNISLFKDISLVDNNVAILKGDIFRNWVYTSLAKKIDPDITFSQFYNKNKIDFTTVTTCLEDGLVYMSHLNFPDTRIYDALICSMNFPYVFSPYKVNGKTYIDGGLIDNFPMHLMGESAIGITTGKLIPDSDNVDEMTPFTYTTKLFQILSLHIKKLNPYNPEMVIKVFIPDNKRIDFDMSPDDKITLFRYGYDYIKSNGVIIEKCYCKEHKRKSKDVLKEIGRAHHESERKNE